jgi:Secretion system C-terminal sorting domain
MNSWCFRSVLIILVFSLSTFYTLADNRSSVITANEPAIEFSDEVTASITHSVVPGPYSFMNLDEDVQVGDTVVVAYNYRDQQHNCSFGKMLDYVNDQGEHYAFLVWTQQDSPSSTRYVTSARVVFDELNNPYVNDFNFLPIGLDGAGYVAMDMVWSNISDAPHMRTFVTFHQNDENTFSSWIGEESTSFDHNFSTTIVNEPTPEQAIWPQIAVTKRYGENNIYVHGISHGRNIPEQIYYWRAEFDEVNASYTFTTPDTDDDMLLISDVSQNLSTTIVASDDGEKISIVSTADWWKINSSLLHMSSLFDTFNNEIVVWTSDDGGDTWDWEYPLNVTEFVNIDQSFLPDDTTSANQDTLRAYCEVDAIYDGQDVLHLVFNLVHFDYIRETTNFGSRIFYWNSQYETFHQIADATYKNFASPSSWEKQACHQQLYKDPDTNILWCMWTQYSANGDTSDTGEALDASDDGFANTDIYFSASPDNGKHWAKGFNVTKTRTMETNLQAGESRSERDPSLSKNNEGGYLNFFYTLDFDAGISGIIGGVSQGEITENQMVYHRVSKHALLDSFNVAAEWVPNYPIHFDDTTGYWEDDNDWRYFPFEYLDVSDDNSLTPDQFELKQNYPNPFNPSTRIEFDLKKAGVVKLIVFDLLGREVAQLVNRNMSVGNHSVTFMADELPSGVYFYKLASGEASQTKKMVLMK